MRRWTGMARGWSTRLLIAFVALIIGAQVLVPVLVDHYRKPLHQEMRRLAEPGRGLVTEIQVALAFQVSALHDFVEEHDEGYLERYRDAVERERRAYEQLAPLAIRLGPAAGERLEELGVHAAHWHATVADFLEYVHERGPFAPNPLQGQLFDELLIAAARLDQAIDEAAQLRRARILEAERAAQLITIVLGATALLAIVAVAWLGHRLRVYAAKAERRRTEVVQLMEGRARLMRGVTHDLKNPLNAIDGYAQLLEDEVVGSLTEKQRTSVRRIRRSVRSLLRLIHDLLELYRVEAGQLVLHIAPIDLRPVIAEAVEEHEAAAHHVGHLIEFATPDGLPTARTDPERVRQVLGNLLSNAVKHTPAGGHITVRASPRTLRSQGDTVDAVAIDVIDVGPGIPAEKHEEIFAEFSRLAPSRRPGAGLGLAIARRIARLLGGEITVASEPGRGSCFTFWVPADNPTTAAAAASVEARSPNPR